MANSDKQTTAGVKAKPFPRVMPRGIRWSIHSAPPQKPLKRNAVDFPLCDAAVRNMDKCGWDLADAILAECSEPGENGVRNGSTAKMEAMRQEIAGNYGVELSLVRTRRLRKAASAFPPDRRRSGASMEAHLEAGTPDVLDRLIKAAPEGTVFTVAKVRELKNPEEKDEQNGQKGRKGQKQEQRHQEEDQVKALQNVCRELEQENEQLLQRYEEACRSAVKPPDPAAPSAVPEAIQQSELPPVTVRSAGVTTGGDLDFPPFLDRRPLTDEEQKQDDALEILWSPFALALANASPLVRYRFETKHNVTLPKTPMDAAAPLATVSADTQSVAAAAP